MATLTRRRSLKVTSAPAVRRSGAATRNAPVAAPRPARKRGAGTRILVTASTPAQRKKLAGEVAAELGRELMRIDLGATSSKYIGETEKNLQVAFAEAESSGAILLLDEADAVFGRRTSVKDSHDRYANQGVDYLLNRLERSPAVVILATTTPTRIDPEIQRRLRLSIKLTRTSSSRAKAAKRPARRKVAR